MSGLARFWHLASLFSCVFLILIAGCISETKPRISIASCDYSLSIHTLEPITNVTFYLPLPVKNGTPTIGLGKLEKNSFNKDTISVEFVRQPPGINLTGAYPVPGSEPWFLEIRADRIGADQPGDGEYSIEISNRTKSLSPSTFMNTLYPLGNESVFLPKIDLVPAPREKIASPSQDLIKYNPVKISQKTVIYADYTTSPTNRVDISSSLVCRNEWLEPAITGADISRIDGGGNEYQDSYTWTGTGESHDWHRTEGLFGSTKGVYPNLSHPRWKEVVAAAAQRI